MSTIGGNDTTSVRHGAAAATERLLRAAIDPDVFGIRFEAGDVLTVGPADAATVVKASSPDVFRRLLVGRGRELAFARAYVAGQLDVEGDFYRLFAVRDLVDSVRPTPAVMGAAARTVVRTHPLDLLRPQPRPPEEIHMRGRLHSRRRDAASISAHYDASDSFFALFLGPSMTYSCAVFDHADDSLETAQANKYDLVCRKLGLQVGKRLLDVGCGWGGLLIHAAEHYGVEAVGITNSRAQCELAAARVAAAGLGGTVDVRLADYRDGIDGAFDAISSIGMFEHVGEKRMVDYFATLESLLTPTGRLLNHAINRSVPSTHPRVHPNGFIGRYVFPDGELLEAGQLVSAMNSTGLEVRHLESLREHYGRTLRAWVAALEDNWDEAVRLTSEGRARVWRLYMAVSVVGFESNELTITQILASKPDNGSSGMPLRPYW